MEFPFGSGAISNFFQADDCSFLTVTRTSSIEQDATQECEQLYGTFKISGVGTFAIENNGDCGINEVFQVKDNVGHPTYDENFELTDDSLLQIEVINLRALFARKS